MNRPSTLARVLRVVLAIITSVALVAAFALLSVTTMPQWFVDRASGEATASHRVVQQLLESYCPARMALPDSGDWGDSEYRASEGDIATSASFAAFGSVYASTVAPFDMSAGGEALSLKAPDNPRNADAMVGRDESGSSRLFNANLLEASDGSGHAGVIASHASSGDLRGISAATCTVPAMTQSFLLSGTATGSSQRMTLANPSSKATTVTITVVGTSSAGSMSLSTSGTATVAAGGETTVDLSAAAPDQQGLYVTITSDVMPVAAYVSSVSADGLTPKGSDFTMPVGAASTLNAIPSVSEGDKISLYAYSRTAGDVTLSWITEDGLSSIGRKRVKADQVAVFDLGQAPKGAHGILATGSDDFVAAARAVRSGASGQEDFASLAAVTPASSSGAALPSGLDATVTLVNTTNEEVTVSLTAMDDTGKAGSADEVTIKANSAVSVKGEGTAVLVEDRGKAVAWGVRLGGGGLDPAKVAGLSATEPTALTVREETIRSSQDNTIVR
ncbi:hypothetical protein JS528_06295 [Bifidobacterium sp. MA2]|uniref:Organic solvents resistance ABC transporter permease n=1 Tax=Bifidobacterium santillanense TaxID=2809028 RepID=A0ABS5UPV0_9BIFI|nr:DUF5719 family protein [Bifidobacterium santillanense]MBT1172971.1 hypothetical protein [Bifidobacterium santillanense]